MTTNNATAQVRIAPDNVIDIVRDWLHTHGYAGLCIEDCGCAIADLAPCGGESMHLCGPGYKRPCEGACEFGKCDFHIHPEKLPIGGELGQRECAE